MTAPSATTSANRAVIDLAGYAVLLGMAWVQAWTPGKLGWGLWVSAFIMVMAWLAIMFVYLAKADGFRVIKTASTLAAIAFAGWMIVWLFRFYGELLDFGYPLLPDPGRIHVEGTTWRNVRPFELWPTLVAGVRQFYVVVLVSLLPLVSGVRRTWPNADLFRMNPGFTGVSYARLHCTVMALMALQIVFPTAQGRDAFIASAVVLTINYFPWQLLTRRTSETKAV